MMLLLARAIALGLATVVCVRKYYRMAACGADMSGWVWVSVAMRTKRNGE